MHRYAAVFMTAASLSFGAAAQTVDAPDRPPATRDVKASARAARPNEASPAPADTPRPDVVPHRGRTSASDRAGPTPETRVLSPSSGRPMARTNGAGATPSPPDVPPTK